VFNLPLSGLQDAPTSKCTLCGRSSPRHFEATLRCSTRLQLACEVQIPWPKEDVMKNQILPALRAICCALITILLLAADAHAGVKCSSESKSSFRHSGAGSCSQDP
jgi:hypothetical protein